MHFSSIVLLASSGTASASIFSNPSTFDFSSLIKRKATCPTYWQQISKDLNAAFLDTNGQCNGNARAAVRYGEDIIEYYAYSLLALKSLN